MVNFYWIFFTEFYLKVDMKIFLENMPQIAGNHIYAAAVLFQNFVCVGGGGGGSCPMPPDPPSLGAYSVPKRMLHVLAGVPTTYFIAIRQLL